MPKKKLERFWFFNLLAMLLLFAAALWFFRSTLLPFFVALALAYIFAPTVHWMESRGMRRGWAVGMLMLNLGLAGAALLAYVLPLLFEEAKSLLVCLPEGITAMATHAAAFANRHGFAIPVVNDYSPFLRRFLEGFFFGSMSPQEGLLQHLVSEFGGSVQTGLSLLTVPFFFFFLVKDWNRFRRYIFDYIPRRHHKLVATALSKVNAVCSSYLRGQLIVSLILGTIYASSLSLLGVRFGFFVGILAGFLNIIPYIGQAAGFLTAIVLASFDYSGPGRLIAVAVVFGVVHLVDSNFITPRIIGGRVGLGPLQTIAALMIGASLAGVVGMIVAVPLAGSTKALFLDIFKTYHDSDYYHADMKTGSFQFSKEMNALAAKEKAFRGKERRNLGSKHP